VHRRFVIDAERLAERVGEGAPREVLQRIAGDVERDLTAPIASLAQEPDDEGVSRIGPSEPGRSFLRRNRSDGKP